MAKTTVVDYPIKKFRLSCNHTILFRPPLPRKGEAVYCENCKRGSIVEENLGKLPVQNVRRHVDTESDED